jgi:hypothetical protein
MEEIALLVVSGVALISIGGNLGILVWCFCPCSCRLRHRRRFVPDQGPDDVEMNLLGQQQQQQQHED